MANDARSKALASGAKVRLITGRPGVGKTFFGCELAYRELSAQSDAVRQHQKILFLTFARNAVARIRQAYLSRLDADPPLPADLKEKARVDFRRRVRVNTFHGFFWWLVGAYGRYAPGGSDQRPWLSGTEHGASEWVPDGYKGYTFSGLEHAVVATLRVAGIRRLVSDLYPLVIVDEFQDVHDLLYDLIAVLGKGSRLVLLRGPGQCIYQGMKEFDPEKVLKRCEADLQPETYEIKPASIGEQRYCREIAEMLDRYEAGESCVSHRWPIWFEFVSRRTKEDVPRELETQAGLVFRKLRGYLRKACPDQHLSFAILTSTNRGVSKLHHRLTAGSDAFKLSGVRADLRHEDALLLHYGRLVLELLAGSWVSADGKDVGEVRVLSSLEVFFQHAGGAKRAGGKGWEPLAKKLCKTVGGQKPPKKGKDKREKLEQDLNRVNDLLRAPKEKLPRHSPPTPLDKGDTHLLRELAARVLHSVGPAYRADGLLRVSKARQVFESTMQQAVLLEKLGVEATVQVMTIHKAKGREFDGVVLVLEDNRKAVWRHSHSASDEEVEDLYRVAVSRARSALAVVAYENALEDARPVMGRLLE